MNYDIHNPIIEAIQDAHHRSNQSVAQARINMEQAVNDKIITASLIEKAKQIFKHEIYNALSNTMTKEMVLGYIRLHDAVKKRQIKNDIRQLKFMELLDQCQAPTRKTTPTRPDLITYTRRFIGKINKTMTQLPIEDWTRSEREQAKDQLEPIIEFYNKL